MVLLLFAPPLLLNFSHLSAYRLNPESHFLPSKVHFRIAKTSVWFYLCITSHGSGQGQWVLSRSAIHQLQSQKRGQTAVKVEGEEPLLATCGCKVNFVEDRSESEIWNHTVKLALPHRQCVWLNYSGVRTWQPIWWIGNEQEATL